MQSDIAAANWHLGTMGFAYKQWVGSFFPAGMPQRNFLAHYSQFFNTVEIDATFYGTPRLTAVQRWHAVTPADFTFCLKTPRAITHDAPIADGVEQMLEFVDVAQGLRQKLGPILIQFGPSFEFTQADNLSQFLTALPKSGRYAVEFRHPSWARQETAVLLQSHHVCWAATDYIHLPKEVTRTTDFLFLRFIGPHGQYRTKDREIVDKTAELQDWYEQIIPHLPQVSEVYGFFNNDYSGHSPKTCNRFKRIVGLEVPEIRPLQQGRLF